MLYNNLVIRVVLPLTLFSGTVAAGVGSELVQEPQIPKNKIDYAAKAALEAELNRARKGLEESRELLREQKYRRAAARGRAATARRRRHSKLSLIVLGRCWRSRGNYCGRRSTVRLRHGVKPRSPSTKRF